MTRPEPIEILLIEDNPGDARLAAEALRTCKMHNTVHTVDDGEKAMLYLRREPPFEHATRPDLIMLDLNLPRKDGGEVLADIKGDETLRRIPVVVLTSSRAEQDILRSYDLHANCFISKPLDLEEFTRVVQSIDEFWFSIVRLPGR